MILSAAILFTASAPLTSAKEAQTPEQARAKVRQIGVGSKARVEVRLRDKTKVKGYVSAADSEDSFTVTDAKTGASRTIAYGDVDKVGKPGGGLSTRGWVILGAAATAAVVVGVTVLYPVLCDGGAGC
jgi:preprotein translocase subunit SecF